MSVDVAEPPLRRGIVRARPSRLLSQALLAKIRLAEEESRHAVGRDEISAYLALSKQLRNSGGYANLVLGDSLRRLAICHAVRYLIESRDVAPWKAIPDMRQIWIAKEPIRALIAEEDRTLDLSALDAASDTELLDRSFAILGANAATITSQLSSTTASTLLDNASLVLLIQRLSVTDFISAVSLPGLVEFLSRGGMLEQLRTDDVRPFLSIMNGDEKRYFYAPLGVDHLYVEHLLGLVELMKGGSINRAFCESPLQ